MSQEINSLLQAIAEKSLGLMEKLKADRHSIPKLLKEYISLFEQLQALFLALLRNPDLFIEAQMAYWQSVMHLMQSQVSHWLEGKSFAIEDKRFSHEDWQSNPFFNLLGQHYLLACEHFNTLLQKMNYEDPKAAKRLQFFSKQFLDVLSPSNSIYTNPELMANTIQSQGRNLLEGLHNLLSDIESDTMRLNITMTNSKAFELGKNIATTPGKVIFSNEMMELIQYTAQTPSVREIPLLIIPPWINKYYILDLSPNNSLVRWLVSQGITVFIISWVNPDARYAHKSFYDYLAQGPKIAIEVIKKQLQVKQVNALGFCIGGTLLTTLLGYNKAHKDNSIRSATFLASMIDFSDPGDMAVFIDEQQINQLEEEMQSRGYLPGEFMASSFNSLRANDLIWSFFIKNYLQGKQPPPFDILYWNADSTNMPATMHSQYLRWMYLHNDLIKPGQIVLNNTPIDISHIKTPAFFLSTEKDHIAPWQATYLGFKLMKGPKRFVLGGSGHIAGIINSPASAKYNYKTNSRAAQNAASWYEKAKEHKGSWWPEWLLWLNNYTGELVPAKSDDFAYKPLMNAPGSYVRTRPSTMQLEL